MSTKNRNQGGARPPARPAPAARSSSGAAAGTTRPAIAAPRPGNSLRVRAIKMGFYNNRRQRPDDVFTLADAKHFSANWMEYVSPRTPEQHSSGNTAIQQQGSGGGPTRQADDENAGGGDQGGAAGGASDAQTGESTQAPGDPGIDK